MKPSLLPQAQNWNYYWGLDQSKVFTKISWSKKRIMSILDEYALKGKHALDAGCGSGFFSKYFCGKGMKVVALDYSDEALKITQEQTHGQVKVVKENLVSVSLLNSLREKFDLVFTDGLLEHFSSNDQDKIIKNLSGVLNPGGVLVTFVPNLFSPWELIRPFYMPGIAEKPFTLRGLMALNTRNHLKVIQKGGINTLPFPFSPDRILGPAFGMLLYTISQHD